MSAMPKTFPRASAELQIPPLRYASVGMTKGRVVLSLRFDARDDEQQVPPLRFASVGMTPLLGTDKELGMTVLLGTGTGFLEGL